MLNIVKNLFRNNKISEKEKLKHNITLGEVNTGKTDIVTSESLLDLLNYNKHDFIRRNKINYDIKELNAIVYFDFSEEDTELPCAVIGVKFVNDDNDVLFDFIVDEYGDGCINSDFANKRRRNKIKIATSFSEYYLMEYERPLIGMDVKVNRIIKTAIPIPGLDNIEGYRLEGFEYEREVISEND